MLNGRVDERWLVVAMLLLAGTKGLELIESRYLADAGAAVGDVRHDGAVLVGGLTTDAQHGW